MKISLTVADNIFSLLIRERAGHICQRCGRRDGALHCSHHWSRRLKQLRWDPTNAFALCFQCHLWWHSNPGESGIWLRNKVGEETYSYLVAKSKEPFKLDTAMKAHILKNLKISLAYMENNKRCSIFTHFDNPYEGTVDPIKRKKRKTVKKAKSKKVIQSKGFHKRFRKKLNGEVVAR